MKKLIAYILLMLYVGSNVGMAAQLNYCGGQLTSVTVFPDEEEKTCCAGIKGMDDCCSSQHVVIKADTKDHQAQQQSRMPVFQLFFEKLPFSDVLVQCAVKPEAIVNTNKAPPGRQEILTKLCIFRI